MMSPRLKEPAPPLLPGAGPASAPGGKSSLETIPQSPGSSPRGPSAIGNHFVVPAISSPKADGPPSGRRVTGGESALPARLLLRVSNVKHASVQLCLLGFCSHCIIKDVWLLLRLLLSAHTVAIYRQLLRIFLYSQVNSPSFISRPVQSTSLCTPTSTPYWHRPCLSAVTETRKVGGIPTVTTSTRMPDFVFNVPAPVRTSAYAASPAQLGPPSLDSIGRAATDTTAPTASHSPRTSTPWVPMTPRTADSKVVERQMTPRVVSTPPHASASLVFEPPSSIPSGGLNNRTGVAVVSSNSTRSYVPTNTKVMVERAMLTPATPEQTPTLRFYDKRGMPDDSNSAHKPTAADYSSASCGCFGGMIRGTSKPPPVKKVEEIKVKAQDPLLEGPAFSRDLMHSPRQVVILKREP